MFCSFTLHWRRAVAHSNYIWKLGANTGVVDLLFLGLKRYECIVHKLSRGKIDHGRIIQ